MQRFSFRRDHLGDCFCEMELDPEGDYVLHAALAAKDAEIAELRREIEQWNPCGHTGIESYVCPICGYPDPPKMIDYLRKRCEEKDAEIAALRKCLIEADRAYHLGNPSKVHEALNVEVPND